MQLRPRFLGRLGVADIVTVANIVVGFVAIIVAPLDPAIAARLILLAAIADGLDGLIARTYGSTPVGEFVDSLADTVSFGVAPAAVVVSLADETVHLDSVSSLLGSIEAALVVGVPALFVTAAVIRLAMYTAYDIEERVTEGVQSTLAATVLSAAILAVDLPVGWLVGAVGLLAYLMITRIPYPDLRTRDALTMGVVQAGAVLAPGFASRVFPRLLLTVALAYFLLAPRFYPRVET
ncbi:CDP-diacylglycerol-serine O-phosphatidyltransferase protein [Halorhabdus tiamatea SARL4B]|uniref:CDP-diacylglycerol-serine O-phosphatidyltransferase n=1 Tax=Halorhabdus tiamatea SARL4B TaxID=1033806 RepID=F7PP57_9EURY|nr:protein sorting system archaetidylserine synthase [Halorhabdus tiamatea]ERJ07149.1 CDP-diacylglycerol-serine O-phosphatidyltransferase protein [Halorhabdus tiamatea SARL4B]CCQ32771.1 CDP-diacylglycerol-serine O-phosphatidyltransferase [Halorhabdus tiamatea SARL4B]